MKPRPSDRSVIAYRRVRRYFTSDSAMAAACGVTPVAVLKWQKIGLPRGWAMLLNETHQIPYKNSDFSMEEAN